MKLEDYLAERKNIWTSDDFRLPETMACVPEEGKVILDQCFQPIARLLDHSLRGFTTEEIPRFAGYGVLTALAQNGMIRAGVETRADEMTRKWGKFIGSDDSEKLKKLEKETDKFKIMSMLNRAVAYCGYYGGCLGFIDTGERQDRLANPLVLIPDTFRKGSFRGIRLLEPYLVTPASYNSINPMEDDYFRPQVWYVQGVPVHSSRMLYFAENELPTIIRPSYNFFGLSLAQKVMDAVSHYTSLREAAARLMEKYALTVFKTNMGDIMQGGLNHAMQKRIDYFVQMRNNDGCAAIDKETEDLVVMTTSMAGVTDLVRQAQEYVAAMFCEPVTKMWGLSPAGFNAGDSDLRNHYDNIAALQQKILYHPMQRLIKVLQMNKYGEIDPDITFEFSPLSDEDENLKISTAKTKCDINIAYMEAGVLSAEEVRQKLIDDPDSGFDGLDPEPPKQPVPEELSPFDPEGDEEEEKQDAQKPSVSGLNGAPQGNIPKGEEKPTTGEIQKHGATEINKESPMIKTINKEPIKMEGVAKNE